MKTLRFAENLIPLILSGEKTATWRLFDDKDLRAGDSLSLIDNGGREFRRALIASVREKRLGEIVDADFKGHERFSSEADMYDTYRRYYGDKVGPDTVVKIIAFEVQE